MDLFGWFVSRFFRQICVGCSCHSDNSQLNVPVVLFLLIGLGSWCTASICTYSASGHARPSSSLCCNVAPWFGQPKIHSVHIDYRILTPAPRGQISHVKPLTGSLLNVWQGETSLLLNTIGIHAQFHLPPLFKVDMDECSAVLIQVKQPIIWHSNVLGQSNAENTRNGTSL